MIVEVVPSSQHGRRSETSALSQSPPEFGVDTVGQVVKRQKQTRDAPDADSLNWADAQLFMWPGVGGCEQYGGS